MNLIELINIDFTINKQKVLKDVSLGIRANECIAITGKNGSGKSTLLKLIAGFAVPTIGKINRLTNKISYVPERPPESLRFTPKEYLRHMGKIAGLETKALHSRMNALIRQFGLTEYENVVIHRLSKGNKQKVNIMQALLSNPDIILLDEPLSGLDSRSQEEFVKLLVELKTEGKSIIFTCHEPYLKEQIADRTINVAKQQIKEIVEGNYFRSIEFSGRSTVFHPFIQNTRDIIDYKCHSSTTYEIKVISTSSDQIVAQIIELGGSLEFVSRPTEVHVEMKDK
ncbi:ABC transporter ATP-binding protein [Lentibacillus sp. L22]